MATKKKSTKKSSKKQSSALVRAIVIFLVIVIGGGGGYLVWDNYGGSDTPTPTPSSTVVVSTDELSVHFIEVGNKYTGDCTLIDIGDTEILIDAGSRSNSSTAIYNYVSKYCADGVLEYVIATHAHQDHIAGFAGSNSNPSIFERFECKTIIDFPKTNATSAVYKNYVTKRDAEVAQGAKHYTALQCYNNEDGAQRTYQLADGITMTILYNYFYENETSDENDYSVCVMITQGANNYLFTGDLEADGESYLVDKNDLPNCVLFKGAHHGSYTASTTKLLETIKPEVVCVCCCCGSDEYTSNTDNMFPSQAFVNRVAPYTNKIYVTTIVSDNEQGYESMNGDITFVSDGKTYTVHGSNNDIVFKDTDWFKNNRTWPANGK